MTKHRQPYPADGDPQATNRILNEVMALGLRTVVPGNGPVSSTASIVTMQRYITNLEHLATVMAEEGEPEGAIGRKPIPAPFAGWIYDSFFEINLCF